MMDIQNKLLSERLTMVYEKKPWYGTSLTGVLDAIPVAQAFKKPSGADRLHSAAELVAHILAWRRFVRKKLETPDASSVKNNELTFRWENYGDSQQEAWHHMLKSLDQNQKRLLHLISEFPSRKFDHSVPGHDYRFRDMLEGVIQHDLYHLGQIVIIIKHLT